MYQVGEVVVGGWVDGWVVRWVGEWRGGWGDVKIDMKSPFSSIGIQRHRYDWIEEIENMTTPEKSRKSPLKSIEHNESQWKSSEWVKTKEIHENIWIFSKIIWTDKKNKGNTRSYDKIVSLPLKKRFASENHSLLVKAIVCQWKSTLPLKVIVCRWT